MLKTKDGRLLAVQELNWKDVVALISSKNPNLAKVMNVLGNHPDFVFYKASYRFGDKIINHGQCYLPLNDGGSIAFDDTQLPDALRNDLIYNQKTEDPLGLILSKKSEFYLFGEGTIQPSFLISPGQMFGIPRAIDNDTHHPSTSVLEFNLNAGSRSIFMLSKISDQSGHSKIQEHYGTPISVPTSPQDHWALFVDLASKANCDWRCEVIYFSRKWINKLNDDEWATLLKQLMMMHRASYNIWHKVSEVWNKTFSEIEREDKLIKSYPILSVNMAKQLFMFTANGTLGFKPATNDDSAPVSLITDAYTKVYNKLTKQKHRAVIMEAAKFNINSKYPIYYSINHFLSASKNKTQISLLDEIRRISEIYINSILENKSHVHSLYDIVKDIVFTYYHSNPENYTKIHSATSLAIEDKRFSDGEIETFPVNSQFFKGCIKISNRNL